MEDYNKHFKRIRQAMKLSRHDVVDIMGSKGYTIKPSVSDGWARHPSDPRFRLMTGPEFDVFTSAIADYWKESDE